MAVVVAVAMGEVVAMAVAVRRVNGWSKALRVKWASPKQDAGGRIPGIRDLAKQCCSCCFFFWVLCFVL